MDDIRKLLDDGYAVVIHASHGHYVAFAVPMESFPTISGESIGERKAIGDTPLHALEHLIMRMV